MNPVHKNSINFDIFVTTLTESKPEDYKKRYKESFIEFQNYLLAIVEVNPYAIDDTLQKLEDRLNRLINPEYLYEDTYGYGEEESKYTGDEIKRLYRETTEAIKKLDKSHIDTLPLCEYNSFIERIRISFDKLIEILRKISNERKNNLKEQKELNIFLDIPQIKRLDKENLEKIMNLISKQDRDGLAKFIANLNIKDKDCWAYFEKLDMIFDTQQIRELDKEKQQTIREFISKQDGDGLEKFIVLSNIKDLQKREKRWNYDLNTLLSQVINPTQKHGNAHNQSEEVAACLKEIKQKRKEICNNLKKDNNKLLNFILDQYDLYELKTKELEDVEKNLNLISQKYKACLGLNRTNEDILREVTKQLNYERVLEEISNIDSIAENMMLVSAIFEQIQKMKDKPIILFMGNKGSGKSTAVTYFSNLKLEGFDNIMKKLDISYPKIEHPLANSTIYAQVYNSYTDNLLLVDCPSFNIKEHKTYANFSIYKTFMSAKIQAIILVVPEEDLREKTKLEDLNNKIQGKNFGKFNIEENDKGSLNLHLLITKFKSAEKIVESIQKEILFKNQIGNKNPSKIEHSTALSEIQKLKKIDCLDLMDQIKRKPIFDKYTKTDNRDLKHKKVKTVKEPQNDFESIITPIAPIWKKIIDKYLTEIPKNITKKRKENECSIKNLEMQIPSPTDSISLPVFEMKFDANYTRKVLSNSEMKWLQELAKNDEKLQKSISEFNKIHDMSHGLSHSKSIKMIVLHSEEYPIVPLDIEERKQFFKEEKEGKYQLLIEKDKSVKIEDNHADKSGKKVAYFIKAKKGSHIKIEHKIPSEIANQKFIKDNTKKINDKEKESRNDIESLEKEKKYYALVIKNNLEMLKSLKQDFPELFSLSAENLEELEEAVNQDLNPNNQLVGNLSRKHLASTPRG